MPGLLLQSNPLIRVNDPNGLFTSDELTRVHDAVVELCGGWVTETTDSTKANGTLGWGQNVLASCLALSIGRRGTPVGADGLTVAAAVQSQNLVNAGISAEIPAFGSVCTSGGGPGLQNQWRV